MKTEGDKKKSGGMGAAYAVWTLLFTACMAVMLLFAANKAIVIADVSPEQSGLSAGTEGPSQADPDSALTMESVSGVFRSFRVPLPKGIRAENVTMENRYLDRELLLYIQGGDEGFYEEHSISGDIEPVLSSQEEQQKDGVLLRFRMNRVLEYKSTMEGSDLTINWYEPGELYDYVVVLDPAGGGEETGNVGSSLREKDVTLQVAKQVQSRLSLQNVRLYCTRTEDVSVSPEARAQLAEEVKADFYIRLSVSADPEDADAYGITGIYNDEFYIPGFDSPALADLLTRETATASSNRATGLEAAGEESVLRLIKAPAAEISLGFLSNPREEYLLGQADYQEKLAAGVLSALTGAVEASNTSER